MIKNLIASFVYLLVLLASPASAQSVVYVDDFGPPTAGNNWTVAIQDAVASLGPRGGTVDLGLGTKKITDTIELSIRVRLIGHGLTQSVGELAPTVLECEAFVPWCILVSKDGVTLEGFHLKGILSAPDDGVRVRGARFTARDLTVSHMGGDGIRLGDSSGANSNYWRLDNVYLSANGRHGLNLNDATPDVNAGVATGVTARDSGSHGINLDGSSSSTWIGLSASDNGGNGLRLHNDSSFHVFIGGNFEMNAEWDIRIDVGSEGHSFLGLAVDSADVLDRGDHTLFLMTAP